MIHSRNEIPNYLEYKYMHQIPFIREFICKHKKIINLTYAQFI